MNAIREFAGPYRFLSNFYPAEVVLDGEVYPTVEHAYQAAKTLDPLERTLVRKARGPGLAKRLGRRVTLRPDWGEVLKLRIMEDLVRQKFSREPLRSKLLATEDAELVEGNTWRDFFWGQCNGQGRNHLGRILSDVRQSLSILR